VDEEMSEHGQSDADLILTTLTIVTLTVVVVTVLHFVGWLA
jgi:hypothetical protein